MRRCILSSLVLLLTLASCKRMTRDKARKLVERYNKVVCEAYRRADVTLIDPVVGPKEGKKLTGLIGVRLDMGITLDAEMLSLEVAGIEEADGEAGRELRVRTKERWHYRDRKIGTGEQVGEESYDSYEMLYLFRMIDGKWMVDKIRFTSTPQVGRKTTPWASERKVLHGIGRSATEGKTPEERKAP